MLLKYKTDGKNRAFIDNGYEHQTFKVTQRKSWFKQHLSYLVQIPGISGLTYMAGKQVIKNIFLIFLLVTMGSIISVNLIHSIARR